MKRHCSHTPTRALCHVLLPACSCSWHHLVVQGWQCSSCISSHRLQCSSHVHDSTCAVGALVEQDVEPVSLCTALQLLLVLEHVQRSAVSHTALDRSRGFESGSGTNWTERVGPRFVVCHLLAAGCLGFVLCPAAPAATTLVCASLQAGSPAAGAATQHNPPPCRAFHMQRSSANTLCVCVIRMLLGVLRFVRARSMHGESARACTLCRTICVPASPCIPSVTSFSRGGDQGRPQACPCTTHRRRCCLNSTDGRVATGVRHAACRTSAQRLPLGNDPAQPTVLRGKPTCAGDQPQCSGTLLDTDTADATLPTVCHVAQDSMGCTGGVAIGETRPSGDIGALLLLLSKGCCPLAQPKRRLLPWPPLACMLLDILVARHSRVCAQLHLLLC